MDAKRTRWLSKPLMVLVLITMASPVWADEKKPPEAKVAVVNGSVITEADLDSEMNRVLERFGKSGKQPSISELTQVRKRVLENLIARELLSQESQKQGIKVDQGAVDEQLKALRGQFSTEAEFNKALQRMNLTEASVRSQLERNLAIKQLIDNQLAEKVSVTDEAIKSFYDSHPDFFNKPEQVKASHILIKVDPKAEESQKAEARKKLKMIGQRLEKGEDFGALAREFSQGPSAAKGGDLGYFKRGQMVKPFEEAAFALKPGEVSDIVETRFGYHLIKVTDKSPGTKMAYAEVKDRLGQYLKQQKVQEEIVLYVESLKGKAKIERF